MLLMIDNYDSFTYNLVQYFGELKQEVKVVRNDEISVADIQNIAPDYLVISPGPCTPNEAGISVDVIIEYSGKIPILGVCLGHQSLGEAFGGDTIKAQKIMHGKTDQVSHNGSGILKGLPTPFTATRYHSLVVDPSSLPDCLEAIASTDDGEIMAIRHKTHATAGVQFHPESISTDHGHLILQNFLDMAV
ncbi:MAG: anthranilate synthase/aminodeoxychorismate synthase-like glutamine amidotransferase [Gammaproteobacteria bacterium]|jgi:anthranilate synthase/aminodeoxychorismate synthase-like glutamine amidotransferase